MKFLRNKNVLILVLIVLFGSVLRLWDIGKTPLSLTWDEVALGYNAYSIFETGRDEFGKGLPVVLRSFDDYKPAFYTYLIIPTYKMFGLNEFSVRLPSAIFGIFTLISVYFLIKKLFKREDIALLATFILAISPWHIQFSRIAFESNVGLALNIFAATFFLYGLKRHWMLIIAALFAGLSVHTYQSERVFTPLFILGLSIIYFKPLFTVPKKYLAASFIVGLLVVLPLVIYILGDSNALLRAKGTSIFNDNMVLLHDNAKRNEFNIETGNEIGKILDNRRVVYAKSVIEGYLVHFSPNWLLRGDIARHHAPEMGLIYIWEFPFILIGIYTLLFSKFDKRAKYFIFFWFLLAPIPASITTGVPHAVRTLNFLPTWQIFSALGLIATAIKVSSIEYQVSSLPAMLRKALRAGIKLKYIIIALFLGFAVFNFIYFLNQYFVQANYFHAKDWLYGHKEVMREVIKREGNFKNVVITNKEPFDKSYMYFLFYSKFSPQKYQESGQESGNFFTNQKFNKYSFRKINWAEDEKTTDTIFVGLPSEISPKAATLTIYYPDGTAVVVISER